MRKKIIIFLCIFIILSFTLSFAKDDDTIYVAFIWNQHQPLYKDNITGEYFLPWVRFHAAKDYYQMAKLVENYPAIHQTFNLTPSLLIQIQDYVNGSKDYYQKISLMNPKNMTEKEKKFIENNFFQSTIPWRESVKPQFENYKKLRIKIGNKEKLTDQDYNDIICFFNLSWIDYEIIDNDKKLREIFNKDGNFTNDDRLYILKMQDEITKKVIPIHRKLQDEGRIEVILTPFYHPILPLLIDTDIARRCNPEITLPDIRFRYPKDAYMQVKKAVDLNKELFGCGLNGMWPSEQAVCPEIIPIMKKNGINWIVTDETMLEKTFNIPLRDEKKNLLHPELLYKPYVAEYKGSKVYVVFRDKEMSDRMCVIYGQMDGKDSAKDFLNRIKSAKESLKKYKGPHLITIALDGENAWENYPDDKRTFFNEFYKMVSKEKKIKLVTPKEYFEKFHPKDKIMELATGSWNNGSLERWIGSPNKNKGWDLTALTRKDLENFISSKKYSKKQISDAFESMYMAEGSDYCWWFDSMPYSQSKQFDDLLRMHLKNVYIALGEKYPEYLDMPILEEVTKLPEIQVPDKPVFTYNDNPDDELVCSAYEYPTEGCFYPHKGYFEINKYEVFETPQKYIFQLTLGTIYNIWNAPLGFSHQIVNIYISTGEAKGRINTYKTGANVTFDPKHPWNYFIKVTGWPQNNLFIKSNGDNFTKQMEVTSDSKNKTITIAIDKKTIPEDLPQWQYVMVGGFESTAGYDNYRMVNSKVTGWFFGKGKTNCPYVLDYLSPKEKNKKEILTDFQEKENGKQVVLYPIKIKN